MRQPAQPNHSLISGIACLQTLVSAERPLGSRELARLLGEEPTRVNRLLGTLASLGLAEQAPDRRYRPGPAVHVLAAQSLHGSALLSCALPELRALRQVRDSAGEPLTVALGVLWNLRVSFLVHARPGQPLEEAIGSHEAHPFDNSSIGVVLAAYQHGGPGGSAPAAAEPALVERLERLRPVLEHVRLDGAARLTFPSGAVSLGVPVTTGRGGGPWPGWPSRATSSRRTSPELRAAGCGRRSRRSWPRCSASRCRPPTCRWAALMMVSGVTSITGIASTGVATTAASTTEERK